MKVANKILLASAVSSLLVSNIFAADLVKEGEKVFNDKNKGNCLACHAISGQKIDGPGSVGPDLSMVAGYDDKMLYDMIYDTYPGKSKVTAMPAFGANGWLTDTEIKAVVAYLKSLQ